MEASPLYPRYEDMARSFFLEAARHLEDSRFLHVNGRYAAAVASASKAAELAIKSAVIVENAFGWWDKLFKTHEPFKAISDHRILNSVRKQLVQAGLETSLQKLESYIPVALGTLDNEDNPEYPWLDYDPTSSKVVLKLPSIELTEILSLEQYRTAHRTLIAFALAYPEIQDWNVTLAAEL